MSVNGYVQKPFTSDQLVERVARLLNDSRKATLNDTELKDTHERAESEHA